MHTLVLLLTRGLIIKLIFGEKKTLANWQLNGIVKTDIGHLKWKQAKKCGGH